MTSSNRLRAFRFLPACLLLLAGVSLATPTPNPVISLGLMDAYIVVEPSSGQVQIASSGMALAYGHDWEVAKLQPYLYHLRHKNWSGQFWKVNTARRVAVTVRRGTFGKLGGIDSSLNVVVDPKGSTDYRVPPRSFLLRLPNARLNFGPDGSWPRIVDLGLELSHVRGFEVKRLKSFLFHVRLCNWSNVFWKVNTSRRGAYTVRGGRFGQLGGQTTPLSTIRVSSVGL